jgi:hypothetical protein
MPHARSAVQRRGGAVVRRLLGLLVSLAAVSFSVSAASAQDGWNPFRERDEALRRQRPLPPAPVEPGPGGPALPGETPRYREPWQQNPNAPPAAGATVERIELEPLAPIPGAPSLDEARSAQPGLPGQPALLPAPGRAPAPALRRLATGDPLARPELWRGLDMARLEPLIAALDIPPRAPSTNSLWRRLFLVDARAPEGARGPAHFPALQLEALYRSGLLEDMQARLPADEAVASDGLLTGFRIRHDLSAGDREAACGRVRDLLARRAALPKLLVGEAHVLSGYCAAADGNTKGAGLAADLAREAEVEAPLALQLLDHIGLGATGTKPKLTWPKRLLVLEYRLLELAGAVDPGQVLPSAEPALLVVLATDPKVEPRLALAAAEAAAGLQALAPETLAAAYGRVALPAQTDPLFRRAALFRQLVAEADPARRQTLARTLLEDARRSNLAFTLAQALAPLVALPDTALAAGDVQGLRSLASGPAAHWRAFADLADPFTPSLSEAALTALEEAAGRGRFTPEALHRLATVLDALDVNVPLPLWEAANRAPPSTTGHLPPTGVLPRLAEAAKRGEVGHTVLLVLQTLGPGGPAAAQPIALGDAIRALRRVGLDADARAVAIDALLPLWPR